MLKNSSTQIVTKLKNSNCEKLRIWNCDKTKRKQIVTKLKSPTMTKLNNFVRALQAWNCYKTKKKAKYQVVTQPNNYNCDKLKKL